MAKKKRVWLGLAISVVCLWLVLRSLDPAALGAALAQANFLFVLPALAVYFFGVWLRSVRWKLLLMPAVTRGQGPAASGRRGGQGTAERPSLSSASHGRQPRTDGHALPHP